MQKQVTLPSMVKDLTQLVCMFLGFNGHALPMCYSSTSASSSHNNGMEGEVVISRPTRCMCNYGKGFKLPS
jgi:hypothetical protein